MSLRNSWKEVDSWQSDASTYRTRQRYKEALIQQGRNEAMRDFMSKSIQDAFTSTEPKMVELRSQMFH
jgi:hypothetical protein